MVIDGGKMETVADFIFLGSKITVHRLQKYMNQNLPDLGWTVPAAMKLKDNSALRENYDQPRQHVKKQRHHFADKCPYCQNYSFSSSHVWRWELDHKESWALKNWCFWTMVLENTLESPLDSKIKLVNPKGNQPWIFLGRIDAETEEIPSILILILGFCFVFSAVSVILQVISFKLTKKRIFKMSPFHHHLQMSGLSEPKIVAIYSATTICFGVIGLIITLCNI